MCMIQPLSLPQECEKKLDQCMYHFDIEELVIGHTFHYHHFLTHKIP